MDKFLLSNDKARAWEKWKNQHNPEASVMLETKTNTNRNLQSQDWQAYFMKRAKIIYKSDQETNY